MSSRRIRRLVCVLAVVIATSLVASPAVAGDGHDPAAQRTLTAPPVMGLYGF